MKISAKVFILEHICRVMIKDEDKLRNNFELRDIDIQLRKELFLRVFQALKKKYSKSTKRLAGEGWDRDYKLLFTTMLSAQSRDETTIPIAEELFKKFKSLNEIANANEDEILNVIKRINYNKTKAKNIVASAKYLLKNHKGIVPRTLDELILMPGVGRKTANLVLGELFSADVICVDTHVHRISNVIGLVNTKTPNQTEIELMKIVPKKYYSQLNRLFVLWGKETPGRNRDILLEKINLK